MPVASETTSTTKVAPGQPSAKGGAPPARGAERGRRKPEFTSRRGFLIAAFMAPAAIFVAVFTYYPMIAGSQMAFRHWNLSDLTDTPGWA